MRGAILYRGPSLLDGSPIVVVATYHTVNGKTGDAIQTWILVDGMSPGDACHTGRDSAICGDCPHRGIVVDYRNVLRSCYVVIHHAPRAVHAKLVRGGRRAYRDLRHNRRRIADAAAGRTVRIGSYGDPAAVPRWVWVALVSRARGWMGYTHQWRLGFALADLCMASTETDEDDAAAVAMGYRPYRITDGRNPPAMGAAVECPATREGSRVQCVDCRACGGTSARVQWPAVFVAAHGSAAVRSAALAVLGAAA